MSLKLKIGEFAKAYQMSVRMIRHYESMGIIHPLRSASNYRLYRQEDIEVIKKAALLNKTGLTLKDIALMHDCLNDKPQNFCEDLKAKLAARRDAITHEIQELTRSKFLLDSLLDVQE